MENSFHVETKKSNQSDSDEKFIYCVDLTVDSPQKLSKTPLKNDNNISDIETTSSVTSWTTSSSNDILKSTNSQVIKKLPTIFIIFSIYTYSYLYKYTVT